MNVAEPIAIVGRGCVLPGCLTPDTLWQALRKNQNLLTWHANKPHRVGGYIQGFDQVFDSERYPLRGINAAELDAVVKWPLHAVSDAWVEAREPDVASDRIGLVLANLSYPTSGKADYACDHWLYGHSDELASNVFNSGLPAQLIASALGATGGAFALDAACASSLYALQIACQKLQQDSLDVVIVSAVNAAHDVMLQEGFSALQALSKTGRSQPFAASADGLVPAQGAAAVVVKRLRDVSQNEKVFGVIRAVGLSNDGRRGGFLVPDSQGQLEAMQNAYRQCGVEPDSIDYLECHATGTPVGDTVEIQSASQFFGQRTRLPVGSLKSNTGHLITVAGLASLLKLTLAMEHETLPPTLIDSALNSVFDGSCLFPQMHCEPWPSSTVRRAAISNFGFGGNNAHLILEQYCSTTLADKGTHPVNQTSSTTPVSRAANIDESPDSLVICALGALAGNDRGTDRIVRRLMSSPESTVGPCTSITLDPVSIRTPPSDLKHIEPQQLALLAVIDDALRQLDLESLRENGDNSCESISHEKSIQPERIGVFAGMGCASDSCRWLLRERLNDIFSNCVDVPTIEALKDSVVAPMTSADVLGAMPNMPANRINAAYDFRAQGYSVSAEELSDVMALQLGCEALNAHTVDLAVVSATDFASEEVRSAALNERGDTKRRFTDKACAVLLMRTTTAEALGVTALATINQSVASNDTASSSAYLDLIEQVYGSAPIADTLFSMVVATALANRGQRIARQITEPRLKGSDSLGIQFPVPTVLPEIKLAMQAWTLELAQAKATPDLLRPAPYLYYASAESDEELCDLIEQRALGGLGQRRVAIVADSQAQLDERLNTAVAMLSNAEYASQHSRASEGIYRGCGNPEGELAFVYTGSAAAYPRMGRGLLMAFPALAEQLVTAFPSVAPKAHLLSQSSLSAYEELCAVTLLSQAQTLLLRDVMRVSPDAILGLSLGETNALYAFGLWNDTSGLLDDSAIESMYEQQLGGEFRCASQAWGVDGSVEFTNWRIYSQVSAVEQALEQLPHTDITIVYSDYDCIVGGPADECASLVETLGPDSGVLMNQHLIVHTPTLQPYANTWRKLHTRPTQSQTTTTADVRVYSHGEHKSYEPTQENIAEQLTRQALQTIDFRKLVERPTRTASERS